MSLSLLQVLLRLSKSPRALVALGVVFVYGYLMLCYIFRDLTVSQVYI